MIVPGLLQLLGTLIYVEQRAVDVVLDLINCFALSVRETMQGTKNIICTIN